MAWGSDPTGARSEGGPQPGALLPWGLLPTCARQGAWKVLAGSGNRPGAFPAWREAQGGKQSFPEASEGWW